MSTSKSARLVLRISGRSQIRGRNVEGIEHLVYLLGYDADPIKRARRIYVHNGALNTAEDVARGRRRRSR
jgi:hypothetical protein